jgi:hypothetical protein
MNIYLTARHVGTQEQYGTESLATAVSSGPTVQPLTVSKRQAVD